MSVATMSAPVACPPPKEPPDDYEVVKGQIVELQPMGARDVEATNDIAFALNLWANPNKRGKSFVEMLIQLDEAGDLQRKPDVLFVSHATWDFDKPVSDTSAWKVIPEIVVEVISTSNSMDNVMNKINDYFQHGVRRVWVVLPRQERVYVYHSMDGPIDVLNRTRSLRDDDILPGFELPLSKVFRAVSPA